MRRAVVIVSLTLCPLALPAQRDSAASVPARRDCWRGKPMPACRSFWITEMAGEYAFVSTNTRYTLTYGTETHTFSRRDESAQLLWRVGPMFNTGPARASGLTLTAGFVNDGGREAIEFRRRRWISETSSLDISAGALRIDVPKMPDRPTGAAYGLTTGAYLGGGDLIHVDAHADLFLAYNRLRSAGAVGGGVGTYGTVVGTLVLAALVAGVIVAFSQGDF